MAFGQLAYRRSLRDIEACLRAQQSKLYHMGIRSQVSRNTLANANAVRDWRIHADVAKSLIKIARRLHADQPFAVELKNAVYALDSTTIDLCLSVFPWADFKSSKAAVKLHTALDLHGNIPAFIDVSNGAQHDVHFLDRLVPEAKAFYIMDRGYHDFRRLHSFEESGAYFVTRARSNTRLKRLQSHPVDRATGLICDQTVRVSGTHTQDYYPSPLRRVRFNDPETDQRLVFLTNNFALPALTVTELYRARWQVELFFKWLKQNLRIQTFLGHSENAVKTQIWIAVATYVLVAIARKRLDLEVSLYQFLQILSVTLFERTPVKQLISGCLDHELEGVSRKQLNLFD